MNFEWFKQHPYMTAGIALVGGILLYTIFFSGGGGASTGVSQGQLDAQNFATQTQGATDYAVASAALQSQNYQAQQQATVASEYIASQHSLGELALNTQLNAQQLQAGVQQSAIAGSITLDQQDNAAAVQMATLQN